MIAPSEGGAQGPGTGVAYAPGMSADLSVRIARRTDVSPRQVEAALELLGDGATVLFVARYRRERTGGLDEVQLRAIAEQQRSLLEIDARRSAIVETMRRQGQLTPERSAALAAAETRSELEALYAPFKRRRKTRADVARERGLDPLAAQIWNQDRPVEPGVAARAFVDPERGVPDVAAALAGARDLIAERISTDHSPMIRRIVRQRGVLSARLRPDADDTDRFQDYADYQEPIGRVPSHRYLAVCRGEAAGALTVSVRPDPERTLQRLLSQLRIGRTPFAEQLKLAAADALKRLMLPAAERAVRSARKEHADAEAIEVFAANLEALLLAAPLGPRSVLGIDPGLRTGCKCALIASTGAVLSHRVLALAGRREPERDALIQWLRSDQPEAIAVGNGTGGREALAVVRGAVRATGSDTPVIAISESGASVYSASEVARVELPSLDLTLRSAVHLARRLQDPLSELVKVPPASIGVGQYQHDVEPAALQRRLHQVVESCVNRVGVDLNTASAQLLGYVAGIGPKLAATIVAHREAHGRFDSRRALSRVRGLGPKTFEQCAGFVRVYDGADPLDASGVHPERSALVARMAADLGLTVEQLVGNAEAVERLEASRYLDEATGRATLDDIARELARPGRDPRDAFEPPAFRDDVHSIEDLAEGMVLEGIVTNVTAFGAFVDLGVHQDGLIHISELADRFVPSPHDVVSPGQAIQVRVLGVDLQRKRISLSARWI